MQVLELLRYDLPRAIRKDWRQFKCGLRGHVWKNTGATHETIKTGTGEWDFVIGRAIVQHKRCAICDKSKAVKL